MQQKKWFVFHNGQLLLNHEHDAYSIPTGEHPALPAGYEQAYCITEKEGRTFMTYGTPEENLAEGQLWSDLRASFTLLSKEDYQLAGKASELLYWDSETQFCSRCGAPLHWHTDISKVCNHCNREVWPQLNTAIIVLIRKGDTALLVKAKSFRRDFFGLVAGFVETGESLEECVQREVKEETGLDVTHIRYFASQPWPYPCGLMVGFFADYLDGEVSFRDGELKEAGFFTRHNLPTIPGKMSMARMLIDEWAKEE